MAEIEIIRNGENIDKCIISIDLKDSKVAEKFVTAYLENMSKVKIEEERTKQIKQQLDEEEKKRQFGKNFYWAGIVIVVGFIIWCICFSEIKKDENVKDVNVTNKICCECNCSNQKK